MRNFICLVLMVIVIVPIFSGCSQKVEEEKEIPGFQVKRRPIDNKNEADNSLIMPEIEIKE